MLVILSLLFGSIMLGIIAGKYNKKNFIQQVSNKASLTVFLILFTFGITIGSNEELMTHIGQLGLTAIAISTACILGSVLFALLIDKLHHKNERKPK